MKKNLNLLKKEGLWVAICSLVLVFLWGFTLFARHSALIDHHRYWFLGDDAMISMRYARNLAEGLGPVWNPNERVEGYTNFLWVVYMALVHLFPIPSSKISLVILCTNLVIATATIPVLIRLVKELTDSMLVAVIVLIGYLLDQSLMIWSTNGFEVTLLYYLFTWLMHRAVHEASAEYPKFSTFIVAGIMALVRADAIVLSILFYVTTFWLGHRKKQILLYAAISLLIPVLHIVFRVFYYGEILPNTAYLKVQSFDGRLLAGLNYVWQFLRSYWVLMGFAAVGAIVSRQRTLKAVLMPIGVYIVYIAYIGGDAFSNNRFFVPILPLLLVSALVGVYYICRLKPKWFFVVAMIVILSMPLYVFNYSHFLTPYTPHTNNLRLAIFLKQNTPLDSKVADTYAGIIFYFSERYAIDLLGKSDSHIAHLSFTVGERPGHNKFDMDYSIGTLKPDFVVANFYWPSEVDAQLKLEQTLRENGPYYAAAQLFNPIFRERCFPYPLSADTWRTVYQCDWSY